MSLPPKTRMRLQFTVALFSLGVFTLFGVPKVEAVQANMVRIQLVDYHSCSATLGTARGNPTGDNIWSAWATDWDGWDPDCVKLYIADNIPPGTDFQICLETQDDSIDSGNVECTPWATEVAAGTSGWSSWAADPDKWAYDALHIKVNTRTSTMGGRYVSNYMLGIQNSRATNDDCTQGKGTAGYTNDMNAGGGWGDWAPDALKPDGVTPEGSNGCARIKLANVVITTYPSVSSLTITVDGVNYGNPGSITIGANSIMSLTWSGTNSPTSCTGTNFTATGPSGTVGVPGPAKGAQITYSVNCTNAGGGTAPPPAITVTRNPDAPITTASVSINGGSYTSPGATVNVNPSDTINIRWSAPGATSCNKYEGAADFLVSNTTGPDGVVPPAAGVTTPYSVQCTNTGGPGPKSNVISIRTKNPCTIGTTSYPSGYSGPFFTTDVVAYGQSCPASATRSCDDTTVTGGTPSHIYPTCGTDANTQAGLSLTVNGSFSSSTTVRQGTQVTVTWNGGNSNACSVNGTGTGTFTNVSGTPLPSSTISGSSVITINSKTILNLSCTKIIGGQSQTRTMTINIIPSHIEL